MRTTRPIVGLSVPWIKRLVRVEQLTKDRSETRTKAAMEGFIMIIICYSLAKIS